MRKRLLSIISALAVSCVIFFTTSVVRAATLQDRLWGNDRYQTNSKIVDSGWTSSEYAVIASGEGFADALCAAPLAQQYKAPILLTGKDTLSTESKQQLSRLNVKKVFIIGGTGVISNIVKCQIESIGIETTRIYGQDRFETSIEVAKNLKNVSGVVVTNGYGFADALSIAPIAAQKGMPILLTDKDDLLVTTKDFLTNKTLTESYIIGGTGVVSDKIASQLKNGIRLGGNSRYETNAAVLNHFTDKFSYDKVYVASGENYPDALSGSVLAASSNSPLILVGTSIDSSVMSSVKAQHDRYKNIIVLGGTGVVSDVVTNSIVSGVASTPTIIPASTGTIDVNNKAKEILSKIITPDMTTLEKEYSIYRYMTNNVIYDDWYKTNHAYIHDYESYGPLVDGIGVCEGYAKATNLLLNSAGIKSIIVTGADGGVGHAWNIVEINNMYYHLDTTQNRFNSNDKQRESGNYSWDRNLYPKCNGIGEPTYLLCVDFYVKGDWIYYIDSNALFKVNADGSQKTKICDLKYEGWMFGGNEDWMFYAARSNYPKIYKVKLDGTEQEIEYSIDKSNTGFDEANIDLDDFTIYDGNIYCLLNERDRDIIYKIDINKKCGKEILESKKTEIKYTSDTGRVCGGIDYFNVGVNGIFYRTTTPDGLQHYRMNFDGTDKHIILSGEF